MFVHRLHFYFQRQILWKIMTHVGTILKENRMTKSQNWPIIPDFLE